MPTALSTEVKAARRENRSYFKSEVARELKVHANTITSWDEIAFWRVPEYREHYRIAPGKFNRRQPLSPYQFWILERIKTLFRKLKHSDRVRQYLSANWHEFTTIAHQQETKRNDHAH